MVNINLSTIVILVEAILSIALVVVAVIELVTFGNGLNIPFWFLTAFYAIFGCMMCISLFRLDCMTRNFYLLKTTVGRGVFNLFVALMVMFTTNLTNIILCIGFGACGVIFIILGITNPKIDEKTDLGKGDARQAAYSSLK